jgi:hypothetical protein
MKKWMISLGILIGMTAISFAQNELSPFVGTTTNASVTEASTQVEVAIKDAGFDVVGSYDVAGHSDLKVFCFSRDDLKATTAKYKDRGALASVLKIGIRQEAGKTEVSLLNPIYMFHAYFGENFKDQAKALNKIDQDAKNILVNNFGSLVSFGGSLEIDDLEEYHYKMMMPYFSDPTELEEYDSFEEGLAFIQRKIAASPKEFKLVYQQIDQENKTAVFGIGLLNPETGEGHFLPIIGERHIAAMPYDIILQGKTVTMLHGKYRIALYWPELSMGTFMKIMGTPGDIEDAMKSITEKD